MYNILQGKLILTSVCMRVCVYTCVYIHVCVHVCIRVCMHVYIWMCCDGQGITDTGYTVFVTINCTV